MSKRSKKPAGKALPKMVYGMWYSTEGYDVFWASEDPKKLIDEEDRKPVRVGVYELVGYATVMDKTEVVRE